MRRLSQSMIASIATVALVSPASMVFAQEAEPDERATESFTSSYAWSHQTDAGKRVSLADGTMQVTGEAWQFRGIESSDPRMEGTLTLTDTLVTYPGGATVSVGAFRIENEGGAWQEAPTFWMDWEGQRQPGKTWQRAFVGEGGYEGLIAIAVDTWRPDGEPAATDIRLDGFIVEGELPQAPEPWSEG